jgi:hypothetical protein
MLEADESDSLSLDYELAGVGSADSNHQVDVEIGVDIEQRPTLLLGISRQRHHVDSLQHRAEIDPACKCRRANDFHEMRPGWIEDVVVPVSFQKAAVVFEVAEIGGDTVCTVVNCEKVGQ